MTDQPFQPTAIDHDHGYDAERPEETVAHLDVTLTLQARIVGEAMTASELGDLIAHHEAAIRQAIVHLIGRDDRQIPVGWDPAGSREAHLTAVDDVDVTATGTVYLTEKP